MKEKINADMIKYALSQRHKMDFFLTEVKTGPSTMAKTLRLDALAIKKSWAQPLFTGYEVKISKNDFLRDDKYLGYKEYCHRLYIVCPTDLIQVDEIPKDVGLMYYNPSKKTLFTKKKAKLRDIEIPATVLYYILLSRLDNERHPFFSSDRESIERYVEDKEDRKGLAYRFKSKLMKQIEETNHKIDKLERDAEFNENCIQERNEIIKLLKEKGIINGWESNIIGKLREALDKQYPSGLCEAISDIDKAVNKAKTIIWPEVKEA